MPYKYYDYMIKWRNENKEKVKTYTKKAQAKLRQKKLVCPHCTKIFNGIYLPIHVRNHCKGSLYHEEFKNIGVKA